ncbi:flavin reductase family protein [Rhodoferax sp. GW822-FHT02A01]|uniref:flavin reductase family protein n=1 Tax=Rhodoferax sp. GW822-FHT02A01 TaxID=3141537 RepID=UPI00315D60EC
MPVPAFFASVPLEKAYRLLNHGPTVLVSSAHAGSVNIMAAAWSCPLDFSPPKVTVVIDKATRTRALVEASGQFVLNLPCQSIAALTLALGSESALEFPDKLQRHDAQLFSVPEVDAPLVQGCVGWLVCKVVPEPHNQTTYDLFIGEVTHAFADSRVFQDGHWNFDDQPDALRTLHYVAGGQFYVTGASLKIDAPESL